MKSKFFKLNAKDFFKGLILSVITGTLTLIMQALQTGTTISTEFIVRNMLIMFIGYLLKNLFTNNQDEFAKKDS